VNRQKVEEVQMSMLNTKAVKEKTQQEKAKLVEQIQEETRRLMLEKQEREKQELIKKAKLIKKIRALEQMAAIQRKQMEEAKVKVNFEETPNHGLLSEMSILELKERAAQLKSQIQYDVEQKRASIYESKEQTKVEMEKKLELIQGYRQLLNTQRQEKLNCSVSLKSGVSGMSNSSFQSSISEVMINDPKLQKLQMQLNLRKQERLQREMSTINSKKPTNEVRLKI
jgi:hypothetical protein